MNGHDIARGIHLELIDEVPADEGSTATFVMIKEFWPYLEATSKSYRFVRYIEEHEWYEMFADGAPVSLHSAVLAQESETKSNDRPLNKKPNRNQKKHAPKQRKAALVKEHSKSPIDDQKDNITTCRRSARIRR